MLLDDKNNPLFFLKKLKYKGIISLHLLILYRNFSGELNLQFCFSCTQKSVVRLKICFGKSWSSMGRRGKKILLEQTLRKFK